MRGQEIVAWSQCRAANGELKNFVGFVEDLSLATFAGAEEHATTWVQNVKGTVKNSVEQMTEVFIEGTNSGVDGIEYVPTPNVSGNTTICQQWQKVISIMGFAQIYGISITSMPDPITPPVPPTSDPGIMGSVVLTTAMYEPDQPYYSVTDIGAPRFDFTHTNWYGWSDKPVTPMASPWQLGLDTYVSPNQLETEIWSVNIPIAKHIVPSVGIGVWCFWNSLSTPSLSVQLITAP